ncbi:MAG TPA: transposase [Chlamydiales bacterium]|nr:transposase [Chlamydiales bacterium]
MLNLPIEILNVLALFSPLFSQPVYKNVVSLFVGHILTKGHRTVADILRTLDLQDLKNFSKFHWVLSGARWSAFKAASILFLEIINAFSLEEIVIPLDTHVERRKGEKIRGLGRQRDAVRSSKNRKVLTIGLLWLVASISVKFPGCPTNWALPFFSQLIPPKRPLSTSRNKRDLSAKSKHKTLTEWTIQLIKVIRKWLKQSIKFVIVADKAFACHKIAHACVKANGALVSRLRMDARIFNFPNSTKKIRGRPLLVGKRCPLFTDYLKDPTLAWQEIKVHWYGGRTKKLLIYTGMDLWYAYGIPPLPIRWVLIKDPDNKAEPLVLFSTNVEHSAERIIEIFVSRWPIEVTFEEAKRHLGIETQRQWSDKAIERTTPCLFASFSIIILIALKLAKEKGGKIPIQKTTWYLKNHATFSDVLSYVRLSILQRKYFTKFGLKSKLGKKDLERLILRAAAA